LTTAHLKDIGALIGDEEDVELFERLIDEADVGGLDSGMLGVGGDEFWERSEESIDA